MHLDFKVLQQNYHYFCPRIPAALFLNATHTVPSVFSGTCFTSQPVGKSLWMSAAYSPPTPVPSKQHWALQTNRYSTCRSWDLRSRSRSSCSFHATLRSCLLHLCEPQSLFLESGVEIEWAGNQTKSEKQCTMAPWTALVPSFAEQMLTEHLHCTKQFLKPWWKVKQWDWLLSLSHLPISSLENLFTYWIKIFIPITHLLWFGC